MNAAEALSRDIGAAEACRSLCIARSTFYRHKRHTTTIEDIQPVRPAPPLALTDEESQAVIDVLHSPRFMDKAPNQVYAELMDEGIYLCSVRTMYRLLKRTHGCVRERRAHVQRPCYTKPELLATAPNQVWSWDITKLKSAMKWTYFYLYVIIDIFSRRVVGWMVAYSEQSALAKHLIQETCLKHNIQRDELILHADRGSSMKSKVVAQLLVDLGVEKTHSRPHVSNDNPFSEAQFKTLKYCPRFPENFGSIEDARVFCKDFFEFYNKEHRHTGIGLMTPDQVHYGLIRQIYDQRAAVLEQAFENHPDRFKGRLPKPPEIPQEVWINKPKPDECPITGA